MDKLISYNDLKEIYGIPFSRRHLDRLEAKGLFPKRVLIGPRKARWLNLEIKERFAGYVKARDTTAKAKRRA